MVKRILFVAAGLLSTGGLAVADTSDYVVVDMTPVQTAVFANLGSPVEIGIIIFGCLVGLGVALSVVMKFINRGKGR